MDAKERYDLLKKLFEEVKSEQKYLLPIDCVLQTGSNNGQFNFTITGRVNLDEKVTSHNAIIPEILDDGNIEAVKAEIKDIYRALVESILDRIAGIGCERIRAKQKPKKRIIDGEEYTVYATSQIPPKTILVSFGDDLWRKDNGQPKT